MQTAETSRQAITDESEACEKWQALALAVASGKTIRDGAEELNISERQAYRFSGLPEFKQKVHELRQQMTQQAAGILTEAASKAAQTLVDMLSEEHEPKDRLAAVRLILANLEPISGLAELRQRLADLEAK